MKLRPMLTLFVFSAGALLTSGAIAQSAQPEMCAKYIQKHSLTSMISVRFNDIHDQGSALVRVQRNSKGDVVACIIEHSSGSEQLDKHACIWVQDHRRSLELCHS